MKKRRAVRLNGFGCFFVYSVFLLFYSFVYDSCEEHGVLVWYSITTLNERYSIVPIRAFP